MIDNGQRRSSGPSVQEILERDQNPVPEILRRTATVDLGNEDLPAERYTSREFHDLEVERMWSRVWQMACREEDIPNPGDSARYDISRYSLIVTRGRDGVIRAFHNSCLHRGTQLLVNDGPVREFRCPYHGFTWALDGEFLGMPCPWDFPHVDPARFRLPEARVGTWGGFVFVCLDPSAPSLEEFLEDIPEHFERWPLDARYKAVHVGRVVPANWKVALEAFIESYHVEATHPQMIAVTGDANTQYDVYPDRYHYTRMVVAQCVASPHLGEDVDEEVMLRTYMRNRRISPITGGGIQINARDLKAQDLTLTGDKPTARAAVADRLRQQLTQNTGVDLMGISDSEALDAIEYHIFPNLVPWAGFGSPMVYRVRPNGDDPSSSYFELMLMLPFPQDEPRPPSAPLHHLEPDESWTNAKELGMVGHVLEQDMANLPRIQRGLRASKKGTVTLASYQEARIRRYHQTIDRYLAVPARSGS